MNSVLENCPKCLKHPQLNWDAIDQQPYCLNCGYRPVSPVEVNKTLWGGQCSICGALCPPVARKQKDVLYTKTCSQEHSRLALSRRMKGNANTQSMKTRVPIHLPGTPFSIQDDQFRKGQGVPLFSEAV